jgi:hypothetical protein
METQFDRNRGDGCLFKQMQIRTFFRLSARLQTSALCLFMCAAGPSVFASDQNEIPENFRIEVTGAAWLVNTSGTIQSNGAPVNLVTDLGAQQHQPAFYGNLVFKPGRKHRIIFEGSPFQVNGYNTVDRSITYRGQTFMVSETLRSSAEMNYFFGGYQYDVVSGPMGHLGFSVGAAYLNATGTIQAVQTSTVATKSETLGLPLAGADMRLFPIPHHRLVDVEGGIRGMGVGSYGHYVEGSANGGLCFGPVTVLAGYRQVNALFHDTSNSSGVNVRLRGPIFSMTYRY